MIQRYERSPQRSARAGARNAGMDGPAQATLLAPTLSNSARVQMLVARSPSVQLLAGPLSAELPSPSDEHEEMPVQLLAGGAPPTRDPGRIHAAARAGVEGVGHSLPHLSAIQRSFGEHDVSSVTAHTGPEATAGSLAMGARAYAFGEQVAFAREPTLHEAAHEAAHVVQQRAGVGLAGGVGQQGDAHERHADAVAARVSAGQSSADLLGADGSRAEEKAPAVQRLLVDMKLDPDFYRQLQHELVPKTWNSHVRKAEYSRALKWADRYNDSNRVVEVRQISDWMDWVAAHGDDELEKGLAYAPGQPFPTHEGKVHYLQTGYGKKAGAILQARADRPRREKAAREKTSLEKTKALDRVGGISLTDYYFNEAKKNVKIGQVGSESPDYTTEASTYAALTHPDAKVAADIADWTSSVSGPLGALSNGVGATYAAYQLATDQTKAKDKATTTAGMTSSGASGARSGASAAHGIATLAHRAAPAAGALHVVPFAAVVQGGADLIQGSATAVIATHRMNELAGIEKRAGENKNERGAFFARFAKDAQDAKRRKAAFTAVKGALAVAAGAILLATMVSNPVGLLLLGAAAGVGVAALIYQRWRRYSRSLELLNGSSPIGKLVRATDVSIPTDEELEAFYKDDAKGAFEFLSPASAAFRKVSGGKEVKRLKLVMAQVAQKLEADTRGVNGDEAKKLSDEILGNIGLKVTKDLTAAEIVRALKV